LLREREVQFLCGAGMSGRLGLPLSEEMARSLLGDLFNVGTSGKEEEDGLNGSLLFKEGQGWLTARPTTPYPLLN